MKGYAMKSFLAVFMVVVSCVASAQGLRNSLLNRNRTQRDKPGAPAAKQEAQPQMTRDDLKSVARGTNGVPALAFNQAPVEMVFKVYGELKGVTVLKDPQTPSATITLQPLQTLIVIKASEL